ncbi:MAG TPA: zf-HC2 domain-containing protein [Kofleriaceae bacterium]|nr:zf-HC2 domain-containing protein [Kofleriaceae bacterium]
MVPHPTALTCREVVELVTELLGGALAPVDRVRLEQHLLVCPPCTLHVGQMQATIALTADLREPAPPAPDDTLEVFRRWKASGR